MKKILFILAVLPMFLMSCSDDDDNVVADFTYGDAIFGTWEIKKLGVLNWPYKTTTATFNSDGTYSGSGYFGNGSGTYTAKGNEVSCYIDGELYVKYVIKSLDGNTAIMDMYADEDTSLSNLTCEKR